MGLCKTSNFSIFTFINGSDLKFCTHSYSSCVYRMMRFKGSNGKMCKMMTSHFRTLLVIVLPTPRLFCSRSLITRDNVFCLLNVHDFEVGIELFLSGRLRARRKSITPSYILTVRTGSYLDQINFPIAHRGRFPFLFRI